MNCFHAPLRAQPTLYTLKKMIISDRGSTFTALLRYYCNTNQYSDKLIFNALENPDRNVAENINFRIPIFKPAGQQDLLQGCDTSAWTERETLGKISAMGS